jgi:DNA-binding response OmpR family regulator
MLTSSEDKSAAFDAGVDDYLNKDIDLLNLPNRVKQLLDLEMD